MEDEVVNRLSRVTDSIMNKSEKLRLFNEKVVQQRLSIEALNKELLGLEAKESLLVAEVNEELAMAKRYRNENLLQRQKLDDLKAQITNLSKGLEESTKISNECFILMSLEEDQLHAYCDALSAEVSTANNRYRMSCEDLLSTFRMRSEMSRAKISSSQIEALKSQLHSVRMQRKDVDRLLRMA